MARRVTWTNNSTDYDGTNVYRDTTIDPQNLPEPIATVDPVAQGATVEYIDLTGSGDQCYAVRDFDSSGDGALSEAYCFEAPATPISWDNLSQAAETGASVSTAAHETGLIGLYVSPDGLRVYVTGNSSDRVHRWDLSTAWDLSTGSYIQDGVSGEVGSNPHGLWFRNDGSRLFVYDLPGDAVRVFDLSTPWDLSTSARNAGLELTINDAQDIAFSEDGSKLYASYNGGIINVRNLSAAWDPSSSTGVASSVDVSATTGSGLYGVDVNNDESQVIVSSGGSGDTVYLFNISAPGDLSTASFDSSVVVANESTVLCAFISRTEGRAYYTGWDNDAVYEMSFPA